VSCTGSVLFCSLKYSGYEFTISHKQAEHPGEYKNRQNYHNRRYDVVFHSSIGTLTPLLRCADPNRTVSSRRAPSTRPRMRAQPCAHAVPAKSLPIPGCVFETVSRPDPSTADSTLIPMRPRTSAASEAENESSLAVPRATATISPTDRLPRHTRASTSTTWAKRYDSRPSSSVSSPTYTRSSTMSSISTSTPVRSRQISTAWLGSGESRISSIRPTTRRTSRDSFSEPTTNGRREQRASYSSHPQPARFSFTISSCRTPRFDSSVGASGSAIRNIIRIPAPGSMTA